MTEEITALILARDTTPSRTKSVADIEVIERDVLEAEGLRLTTLQHAFVYEYVKNGGKGGKAARAAGYEASGADSYASRLLRLPSVNRAIYVVSACHLGATIPAALRKVAKLSVSAKSEYVQLEASKDLLDRAGFTAPKKIDVSGAVSVVIDLG